MGWWEGVEETRILIAPELGGTGYEDGQLISLRHPKSGDKTCYLLNNEDLKEIHWLKQSYGSWFLGDCVFEDGGFYTVTPIDPVFIMLPIFEEARMKKGDDPGKFRTLDEIIYIDGYPGYQKLLSIAENTMQIICEMKEIGPSKFFRLDDMKVLIWLKYKVNQLELTLPTLDKNYATQDDKGILVDAVSIVGEYLNETWLKHLCSELNVKLKDANTKISTETLPIATGTEEKSANDKKKTKTVKQSKRAKPETDSQNIRDMFRRASRRS